ncbi:MAG: hypothetical protein HQL76_17980 [Magnetococcales bacterium]|nr:hypothetical protein [Magnetococcales bacterium]
MMDCLVSETSERESQNIDRDPLNLKGSYDAPAFIRLGRKLGADHPSESGVQAGAAMGDRCS